VPLHTGRVMMIAAAVGFAAVTGSLTLEPVRALDVALRDLADAHRPQLAYDVAVNLNRLGSGGWLALVALIIAIVVTVRVRQAWPLLHVAAAFLLTGAVLLPLKVVLHRPPPHSLVTEGLSYPSGHAANTIVWYGVLCALAAPWLSRIAARWLRWAPPIIVGLASVYLGFHWLTDILAGLCLGLVLDRVLTDRALPRIRPGTPQPLPP
jgi:membrane-associated phospholipid phosphatase